MRSRRGRLALACGLVASGLASGCDAPPDPDAPGGPALVASEPIDGDGDVDRRQRLHLTFDRLLWPRSVSRQSVRLESGGLRELLSVRFDPVRSTVVAEQFNGRPLEPNVTYRLTVEGVIDLDGLPAPETRTITFRTGDRATDPPTPIPVVFADVSPVLAACATAGCHVGDDAALGLDLSSGDAIRRTAIGVPSRQLPAAATSEGSDASLVLSGLPIVDVVGGAGRPARSYLVYKLLGDPHAVGTVMPPAGGLPRESLELLSDWILAGAPTD